MKLNEELAIKIINSATTGIYIYDLVEKANTFTNDYYTEILGYTKEEINSFGKDFMSLFHKDDHAKILRHMDRVASGQEKVEIEYRFKHKKGHWVWCLSVDSPFAKNEKGEITSYIGSFLDISQRKFTEEKLTQQKILLDKSQKSSQIGSFDWDIAKDETNWSDELYRIAGSTPETFDGSTKTFFQEIIHPEDRDRINKITQQVIEENHAIPVEYRIVRKSGEVRHVSGQGEVILDEEGNPTRIIGTIQDITERKELELSLRQAQKMESLGVMAGGMAHEFNNALSAIQGYTEMAELKLQKDSLEQKYLKQVLKATRDAGELVQQILLFSRKESKEFEIFSPIATFKHILKVIRATTPANIDIVYHIEKNCGKILGSPTQIGQVVTNFINNSLHALEKSEGGSIIIEAKSLVYKNKSHFYFSIQDTGSGISSENLPKIYDPFFTTKEDGKGTGLGLAVVHGIVKAHQGNITVDSKWGEGTTFKVFLPLTEEIEESRDPVAKFGNVLGKGFLLVVEDKEVIAQLYKDYFELIGYQVQLCPNGKEALDVFSQNPNHYDLLLSDMEMPLMTGKQLAREILHIRPSIPFILTSGYSESINEKMIQEIGIRKFLPKPIELSQLGLEIKKCLEDRE
ncbi:MAG: PAS domain-containing protein [Spirochaetota bacterium]